MPDSTLRTWKPFLLYGLTVAAFCGYILTQNAAARGWPTVPGTVVSVEDKQDMKAAPLDGQVAVYQQVEYVYMVGGREYRSHRISYIASQDEEFSMSRENAYQTGQALSVHYNPRDPANAYVNPLDPGDDQWLMFVLLAHALLVMAGFVAIVRARVMPSNTL